MTDAVVVAAHPDDEVLGASGILTSRRCTIVLATDGVPPDADDPGLAERRIAEARAAHRHLDARVDAIVRLRFADQRLADAVGELASALVDVVATHDGADVYVPAYQRGHPDHDAVYVAAQVARARLDARAGEHTRQWFAYTLYGLDRDGEPRFDWLDPDTFYDIAVAFDDPGELERKAAALRRFVSQRPDDSVLAGWLGQPVAERYAPLPQPSSRTLPDLRCFSEEIFRFSQFGIDPARVVRTLEAALEGIGGP